jgi:hypothetical protein
MARRLHTLARHGLTVAVVVGCGIGALAYVTRDSETYDVTYGAA